MNADPSLDQRSLAGYLRRNDLARADSICVALLGGGRSNLTFDVTADDKHWVLRRPPLGDTLATAHDVKREFTVISALYGTDVPVPRPIAFCPDCSVLGAPFYLMERVDGDVLRSTADVMALSPDHRRSVTFRLIEVLADLHTLDPAEVGLEGFGHPQGFMQRQVRRWTQQLHATRDGEIAGIDTLAARLAEHVPSTATSAIVHGDYRLDNCVTRMGDIKAVLDWEMSTLGDPMADLATFIVYHDGLAEQPNPVVDAPGRLPDVPAIAELLASYEARTVRTIQYLEWYLAFAWFKLAVILDGVRHRSEHGRTSGGDFAEVAELIAPAVEHGLAALETHVHRSSSTGTLRQGD
jgi:aminoglycoside phosphotransferase (APT) family kinase protein